VGLLKRAADKVGDVAKGPFQKSGTWMAKEKVQGNTEFVLPLANCASIECILYIRD